MGLPDFKGSLLYRPEDEHDACGVGFVADILGNPSHQVLSIALEAVSRLTHRGAFSADARTGDGAGILTQIPFRFFQRVLQSLGHRLSSARDLAVGMVFLPRQDPAGLLRGRALIEEAIHHFHLKFFGWREVPLDVSVLGEKGAAARPEIEQVLLGRPGLMKEEDFERVLFRVRKRVERRASEEGLQGVYIPSLSSRTLVYKGLMVATGLSAFYPDLKDPAFETALAIFHQRYSTNTFPTWELAHPFRMLAHNGEINTLQGNRNWMRAREPELSSSLWGEGAQELRPLVSARGSDSMSLDNALEALTLSGREVIHAMMILIPEAWEEIPDLSPEAKAFYQYHACLSEPWDGPAALAFTDGMVVGAMLDRNGLRPVRYKVTQEGLIVLGSEVGIVDLEEKDLLEKGQLKAGQMIAVDTRKGLLLKDKEAKEPLFRRRPYGRWIRDQMVRLEDISPLAPKALPDLPDLRAHKAFGYTESSAVAKEDLSGLLRAQKAFGYTEEEIHYIFKPMGLEGKEPTGSMGDDTPLAILSRHPRPLYSYFKQKFAQVTNPAIDPIREKVVMSLSQYLGISRSLLEETEEHARRIHLKSPLLQDHELEALRAFRGKGFSSLTIPALFDPKTGPGGLEGALDELCAAALSAVDTGHSLLILSDREMRPNRAAIPMLLAVGAVHHHLIRTGRRMRTSLIAETGEAREIHHLALLIGFGASAIHPYLALATATDLARRGGSLSPEKGIQNYVTMVEKGLLKVISKMGISCLSSYHGAQIFEAIGLGPEVVDRCFPGTPSPIGGVGFEEIAREILLRHQAAYGEEAGGGLELGGDFRFRKTGEYHAFNPEVVKALHRAAQRGDRESYRAYAELVNRRQPMALRDLLTFRRGAPVPLEEVEAVEEIWRRFSTAGMSLGALSPEAHETLAIAMNRIGAKSNTGEGGEDPVRFPQNGNGGPANSRTKQVASARFGVTPAYLAAAEELQIKIAQGSKPGEGGQLPGHKVAAHIARIRHSVPGVSLISPPPHHDIYSIEDLAQLIYDLKQANPRARVSVKLVAESGIGTIAAGVAKAHADIILISGHDGGTGASPLSSIKNAGCPWELGLAEVQQVLVLNDLRGRVLLRVDGGMKTGRDVLIAALLGAEEYGFGTAALVAQGCIMARQCHLNTCPVGIATQRPELRAKFPGTPEAVVTFFRGVAEEVRELLAGLGFRSLDEVIGRVDLLEPSLPPDHPKASHLNLSALLGDPDPSRERPRRRLQPEEPRPDLTLDDLILKEAQTALEGIDPSDNGRNSDGPLSPLGPMAGVTELSYEIRNVHRAVGTKVAGEIAWRFGDGGLPKGTLRCRFTGSAGQSFGAFLIRGMEFVLLGEANDYAGKGMGGGLLVIRPEDGHSLPSRENSIVGNAVLYGATGGEFYAAGRAGERFAVRNSGALAVIEGVGDHGCEYMTGGRVVVLGRTGRNFAAGMSGGVAYVLDEEGHFPKRLNGELVSLEALSGGEDERELLDLIHRHAEQTGSQRAQEILAKWTHYREKFWRVLPHPPEAIARLEDRGANAEEKAPAPSPETVLLQKS